MTDSAPRDLDALLNLSGDPIRADSRNLLIKGASDAALRDFIGRCLDLNTSRVVLEHIVKYLLDEIAGHVQPSTPQGNGYIDALCVLSGDPAHAGARHTLIKKASDMTLQEIIRHCSRRGASRAVQERAVNTLVDAITEQTRSRTQEGALTIKEEYVEEFLEDIPEEGQSRRQRCQEMEEDEDEVQAPGRKRKQRVQTDVAMTDEVSASQLKDTFLAHIEAARDPANPPDRTSIAYTPEWPRLTHTYRTNLAHVRLIEGPYGENCTNNECYHCTRSHNHVLGFDRLCRRYRDDFHPPKGRFTLNSKCMWCLMRSQECDLPPRPERTPTPDPPRRNGPGRQAATAAQKAARRERKRVALAEKRARLRAEKIAAELEG